MRRTLLSLSFVLMMLATPFAGASVVGAQGQVYTDTMDSAETGLLSTDTFDPSISFAYQDGQFVVDVQQPSYAGDITSTVSVPAMTDSLLTVDAAISGDPNNKYVFVGCRHTDAGEGYSFGYLPATGDVLIWRRDTGGDVNLAVSTQPTLINAGSGSTQVGIECTGGTLTGLVNGQPVLTTFDSTYPTGRPTIGLGANGRETDGLRVSYDNLSITDTSTSAPVTDGSAASPVATAAAPAPTEAAPVATAAEPVATTAEPVATTAEPAVTTSGQTEPIADPNVDPAATLQNAYTVSLQNPPVVSGLGEDLNVDLNTVWILPAGVELVDFYAEFFYTTPTLPEGTVFQVGFCFWTDPSGNCSDVYLESDSTGQATWGYGAPVGDQYEVLDRGDLPAGSVDPTPGARNFISLTVYDGVAILSGSSLELGASIPLQAAPAAGDVLAEAGFFAFDSATTADPLVVPIYNFAVWDLSSGVVPVVDESTAAATEAPATVAPDSATTDQPLISGPAIPPVQGTDAVSVAFDQARNGALAFPPAAAGVSGDLTQSDNEYAYASSGVTLADFYTIVTITNPSDLATPSDVGIGFRADQGTESGLRFVVTSDGTWYLQQAGQSPYASGPATGFVTTPGASNVIELLVQGPTGIVVINGTALPALDLSPVSARGDVYVGTGFFQGDTVAGRVVPYSDWWLYPTDVLDVQSG